MSNDDSHKASPEKQVGPGVDAKPLRLIVPARVDCHNIAKTRQVVEAIRAGAEIRFVIRFEFAQDRYVEADDIPSAIEFFRMLLAQGKSQ